jgi:hypothetical protein
MDEDVAILHRQDERDLALEVEMILAADREAAGEAARAAAMVSAATANSTWPWNLISSTAKTGSSPAPTGLASLVPGMSAAVSTATTPGAWRTAETSSLISRARARSEGAA